MRSVLIGVLLFLVTELSILAEGNIHVALANGTKLTTAWKKKLTYKTVFTNWKVL